MVSFFFLTVINNKQGSKSQTFISVYYSY